MLHWIRLLFTSRKNKNKLIERTCKHDAYQSVWMWAKGGGTAEEALDRETDRKAVSWYAHEKMHGHLEYLAEHRLRYAFSGGFVENDGYYDRELREYKTKESVAKEEK